MLGMDQVEQVNISIFSNRIYRENGITFHVGKMCPRVPLLSGIWMWNGEQRVSDQTLSCGSLV